VAGLQSDRGASASARHGSFHQGAAGRSLDTFARGLAACYAGNLAEAERIFRQTAGVDPAAQAYADRCRELAAALTAPTTGAWTGVWVMTSK
jgi:adenylate cyclase